MKKLFALFLFIFTVILVFEFSSGSLKKTDYYGKFDGASTDSMVSLFYEDVEFGYRQGSYMQSSVTVYDPKYNGSKYSVVFASNEIVVSLDYIYIIRFDRFDSFCKHISDSLDSGGLIIDIPLEDCVVFCLLKSDSIGFSVGSGSLDGQFNAINSYINASLGGEYLMEPCLVYGEFQSSGNLFKDRALQKASTEFLTYDFRFIPSSDSISYGFPYINQPSNPRQYSNIANLNFYRDFVIGDFSKTNGEKYISNISNSINDIGEPPLLPDTEFGEEPLQFIADYFSWIVGEIVYLTKFMVVIFRGIF